MRGLKFLKIDNKNLSRLVAPFAGAWIEIYRTIDRIKKLDVAPFAGAWIEILLLML